MSVRGESRALLLGEFLQTKDPERDCATMRRHVMVQVLLQCGLQSCGVLLKEVHSWWRAHHCASVFLGQGVSRAAYYDR